MNSLNLITKSALMSPSRVVEPLWWVGHIPFVMWLVENTKPQTLVELGTHTGNSYFAICQSVKSNALPTRCYAIDTWQGDLHQGSYEDDVYHSVKQYNDSHYSEFSDLLRMTFDEALPKFSEGAVDFLHIDGLHTYEAARHDFETWLPKLSDRAVVLFHDTAVRKLDFGVWRLWEELSVKYPNIHFDYSQGLGVLFVGASQPLVVHGMLNSWATPEGQSVVHQFFARLGQSVEFEYTTANPNQAIVKRDQQICGLNQVLSERNEQITQQQGLIVKLRNVVDNYRTSMSWQITKPLREVSLLRSRLVRLVRLYQNYGKRNSGIGGLKKMLHEGANVLRKGGLQNLQNKIRLHEHSYATGQKQTLLSKHNVLMLKDSTTQVNALPKDVAVHVHMFYADMAQDIRAYLENIPTDFHLYVTTDTPEKAETIRLAFLTLTHAKLIEICTAENRGRDIFPMLVTLGPKLVKHDLVLHIHTKRSPHNSWELGGWRRYLMESVLGNPQRVVAILQEFMRDKNLGILFPSYYHPIQQFLSMPVSYSERNIQKLLVRTGKKKTATNNIDTTFFPAGDMFWFRGKAIEPFINMNLSSEDFEPEEGQVNMTMAHAIERMFPYFAADVGLHTQSYLASSILSRECSAHKFDLFQTYLARGLFVNPTIIFDHNGGGGTTIYTGELVKNINGAGNSVLRIYCFDAVWFVQWRSEGDGMLFYTSSIDELFNALSISRGTNVIVNSMYGYPDVKEAISRIVTLAQTLNANLDVKTHDFYALCPSPHLSNFEGKYCGVPQDLEKCDICLKKNHGWFHSWYPEKNKPVRITEWREPFTELYEAATSVSIFDQSTVEILRKGFKLEDSKIKVMPHDIDYFECSKRVDVKGPLHIGVLGTLSISKGGNVVNEICNYAFAEGLRLPVTIVGSSVVDLPAEVNVWGSYTPNDLPRIISHQGINVILMPSIVPETFSYTISEAMKMGLPIVAFDLGAQGNRVKQYELGKVIPLGSSPEAILAAIQSALKTAQELRK